MESIWVENSEKVRFDALRGNKKTDVLIVGGGITGILCAYKLKNAGVDFMLVEACEILGGITRNTTAKLTLSHGLMYDKLIKRFGVEKSRQYLNAQLKALEEYERLCKNIDCDYEKRDNFVYSLKSRKKIEGEVAALERLGVKAAFSDSLEIPLAVAGAVRVNDQAQFHPLKFLYEIVKELPIFEDTKVTQLKPKSAVTGNGEIEFKRLIIATHFPILNKHGLYPIKLYQHRSYVIALKGAGSVNGMYVDESERGLSFRSYKDLLLLGCGGHRTGKKGGYWQDGEDYAKEHFENARIVEKWATQDCMTLDRVPYIGRYSASTPDVFVATGFNKWGMTNAMVASDILCDLVLDKHNPYAEVFSPSRSILHTQLAVNIFESAVGLLTPTAPRCPHLGCALKYNPAEHSWDCPCHGSRFSEDGRLIDNPATDDKKL